MQDKTAVADKRLAYLDGWRGLAICGVLLDHCVVVPFINTAQFGVELFFALSGRLMAEILFVNRYPLPDFFFRRFSRVWPVLAIFTIVFLISPVLTISPLAALSVLTFTWNYAQDLVPFVHPQISHLWSLCVEEHSYLILAAVAWATRRNVRSAIIVISVIALACVANGAIKGIDPTVSIHERFWWTDVRAASILIPCVAYLLRDRIHALFRPVLGWVSPVAFLVGVLLFSRIGVPRPVTLSFGTAALAIAVVCLPEVDRRIRNILEARWLVAMGLWSYSIYLWQQPISKMFPLHSPTRLLGGAISIVVGFISFKLLEQPIRRGLNHWWGVRKRVAAPLRGL